MVIPLAERLAQGEFPHITSELLTPDARETLSSMCPPEFDSEGRLTAGNFSVYFIGSVPTPEPFFLENSKSIETWPQLSKRKEMVMLPDGRLARAEWVENMYVQFSEGIPGVVLDTVNEKMFIDTRQITDEQRLQVASDWMVVFENKDPETNKPPTPERINEALGRYSISPDFASGLYWMQTLGIGRRSLGVKGHQTGLFSWGIEVPDQNFKPIIYDDEAFDTVGKALLLKARWQYEFLKRINPNTVFHLDEPDLKHIGSSQLSVGNADKILQLEFSGIPGNFGAHCCSQTEYAKLFKSDLKIVALDLTGEEWSGKINDGTSRYADAFIAAAHAAGVGKYLERGGIIALGVVPYKTSIDTMAVYSHVTNILYRLSQDRFNTKGEKIHQGIDIRKYIKQFVITPVCGAGSETEAAAKHAFSVAVEVADMLQKDYLLHERGNHNS